MECNKRWIELIKWGRKDGTHWTEWGGTVPVSGLTELGSLYGRKVRRRLVFGLLHTLLPRCEQFHILTRPALCFCRIWEGFVSSSSAWLCLLDNLSSASAPPAPWHAESGRRHSHHRHAQGRSSLDIINLCAALFLLYRWIRARLVWGRWRIG